MEGNKAKILKTLANELQMAGTWVIDLYNAESLHQVRDRF